MLRALQFGLLAHFRCHRSTAPTSMVMTLRQRSLGSDSSLITATLVLSIL